MSKRCLSFILSMLLLCACAASLQKQPATSGTTQASAVQPSSPAQPSAMATPAVFASESLAETVKNYRQFKRMTEQPHLVDAYISLLCRGAIKEDIVKTDALNGPHARSSVHIFANSTAVSALEQKQTPYPVGTVIIKEKEPTDISYMDGSQDKRPKSLGGMRKREAGYDPANGDWEYFYQAVGGPLESGRMANCIQCHRQKQQQDYVFKNWMPPTVKTSSRAIGP